MQGFRDKDGKLPLFEEEDLTTVSYWMREAQALNIAYADRYEENILWQPWLDLPIIGLAAAGVGSLLFGGSTQLTAALSLGAGGLTAVRAYTDPGGTAIDYLAGVEATDCVIASAGPLQRSVDDNGRLLPDDVHDAAAALRLIRVTNAHFLVALPPDGSSESQTKLFVQAQASLRAADDAAGAILAAYAQERNAARDSASVLAATLGRIKVAVARAVQRQAPAFAQVQSDVVAIVEQAGAQQQRLDAAKGLIAGRAPEQVEPRTVLAPPTPRIDADAILAQAAVTAHHVESLGDHLPRVLATNANIAKCAPV